ncbi:hypothetical protein PR001_g18013 [Phytophthora rubi]|uniref:Integrase catalytic domain-containing protein n=1 Tax=Phytophthora rubi TaxID=129364 RepID=A0A6A3KHL4_9STRA|nr:hypothetical protein PR001_g18013 [Phytophthora rubi]
MKKCHWGRSQVAFLGHIVTPTGILPNPEKVKAVMNVQRLRDVHDIRSFLGLTSYFRRYIPGYALISTLLERLKMKDAPFNWTEDCKTAFRQLKRAHVKPSILVYPDMKKRFKIYVDSSRYAVGACLMQEVEGRNCVVAYASKLLIGSQKNWVSNQNGISEIECWGIVWTTRTFRCYLDKREFDLFTDHQALTREPSDPVEPSSSETGAGFDLDVPAAVLDESPLLDDDEVPSYLPASNLDLFGLDVELFRVEQKKISWIVALVAFREDGSLPLDPNLRVRVVRMAPKCSVENGLLMRRVNLPERVGPARSIAVPVIPLPYVETVLHFCHSDLLSSHLGLTKTLEKVKSHAYWPGWHRDVEEYLRDCDKCGSGKGARLWRAGRMQRMPVADLTGPFPLLVVDAIGPLPETNRGNKYILVFVDYFTRWAEAFAVDYLDSVTFVDVMVKPPPDSRVLFAYRTAYHEALGDSPFFSLYGRDPVRPLDVAFLNLGSKWKSNEVAQYRRELYQSLRSSRHLVERQLLKAQDHHEQRLEGQMAVMFEVGDPVWVYQAFRARRGESLSKKLAFSWHGPYRVVCKVGDNAYRVDIPTHPSKTVTVNVNRLKKYRGKWTRPFMDKVPAGVEEAEGGSDGPLEEDDLPSSSFAERITIGADDTAVTGTDAPLLSMVTKRVTEGEVEYLALTSSYETFWLPRETLLPEYSPLVDAFERAEQMKRGLPELRRSVRLADANAQVDDDYLLMV